MLDAAARRMLAVHQHSAAEIGRQILDLHTSAYVSIRQHTSAYGDRFLTSRQRIQRQWRPRARMCCMRICRRLVFLLPEYVSLRQHTSGIR